MRVSFSRKISGVAYGIQYTVTDGGPPLSQHWVIVSYTLGQGTHIPGDYLQNKLWDDESLLVARQFADRFDKIGFPR